MMKELDQRVTSGLYIIVPNATALAEGEVRQNSSVADKASALTRELVSNIGSPWKTITEQIGNMIAETSKTMGDYSVESVTVKLGVDGKGNFGVVSAGVSASFEVKFKRSGSS